MLINKIKSKRSRVEEKKSISRVMPCPIGFQIQLIGFSGTIDCVTLSSSNLNAKNKIKKRKKNRKEDTASRTPNLMNLR